MKVTDRHGSDLVNVLIADSDCQRLLFQPHALTFFTGRNAHIALILLLHGVGEGLLILPLHILDQPLKGNRIDALSPLSDVMHLDLFAVCPVNQDMLYLLRVLAERSVQIKLVFPAQCLKDGVCKALLVRTGLPARHRDCPLIDT